MPRDDSNRPRVPDDLPRREMSIGQPNLIAVYGEELAAINLFAFDPFLHTGIIMAA